MNQNRPPNQNNNQDNFPDMPGKPAEELISSKVARLDIAERKAKKANQLKEYRTKQKDPLGTGYYSAQDFLEDETITPTQIVDRDFPVMETPIIQQPSQQEYSPQEYREPEQGEEEAWKENKPVPPRSTKPKSINVPKDLQTKDHPLLAALRNEFGISKIDVIERTIGGRKWAFRKPSAHDESFAVTVATFSATTEKEYESVFSPARVCCSIVALDDIPIYKVLGVDVSKLNFSDPLDPPKEVRRLCAVKLFEMLFNNFDKNLLRKLTEAYDLEFNIKSDSSKKVYSYLDDVIKMKVKCPGDDCGNVEDIMPDFTDEEKTQMKPHYCCDCGSPMTPVSKIVGGRDVPLV